MDENYKKDLITFVESQPYFLAFNTEERKFYYQLLSKLPIDNHRTLKIAKNRLIADYFLDAKILNYPLKDKIDTKVEVFFVLAAFPVMILTFLFFAFLSKGINLFTPRIFNLNILTIVLGISGALLAGLDIFLETKKLAEWDKTFWNFIQLYLRGYKDSIKNAFLIYNRRPIDLADWVVFPFVFIGGILAFLSLINLPSDEVFSFLFLLIGVRYIARKNIPVAVLCIFLAFNYAKGQENIIQFIWQDSIVRYLYFYFIILFSLRIGYDGLPKLRKYFLCLIWILGFPFIFILKIFFRTIPFVFSIPFYYFTKLINKLKPTSLLRLIGLVLIISSVLVGYFT